jgi:DNA modification methylase
MLTGDEKNELNIVLEDKEFGYKAKVILLKDDGYTVQQKRMMTNHHDNNTRNWMHKLNQKGIDGISYQRSTIKTSTSLLTIWRKKDSKHSICKSKSRLWFGILHLVLITCTGWLSYAI